MSLEPLSSPLITPDLRRRLQQRYEEAQRLAAEQQPDFSQVHERLAECLRADSGNTLYLDALLANLKKWGPPRRSWLSGLLGGSQSHKVLSTEAEHVGNLLQSAPELLRENHFSPVILRQLAEACAALEFDDAELRYLYASRETVPDDSETLRMLARSLTRQGRFDEALVLWKQLVDCAPSDVESSQAVADLTASGRWKDDAELAAAVPSLQVLAAREDLVLAQSAHRLGIARRRATSDPHPRAQALVGKLETEHNRLEIDIYHLRSEREPGDLSLRLELAKRLKKAGNFSGAIQRLEEAQRDPALAAESLLELGECWQSLRQFGKALDFYRQALAANDQSTGALYRLGVLAAAMNEPAEARGALARLVAMDPGYKDARQRLDKLS